MQVDWCGCCCKKTRLFVNFQTQYSQWTLSIGQRYHTFAKCTWSVCHLHRIKGWLNYNLNARFGMHLKLSLVKCKEKILLIHWIKCVRRDLQKTRKKVRNQQNKNRTTKIVARMPQHICILLLILFLVGMFFSSSLMVVDDAKMRKCIQ